MIAWRTLIGDSRPGGLGLSRGLVDVLKPAPVKVAGLNPVPDARIMQGALSAGAPPTAALLEAPAGGPLDPRDAAVGQRAFLRRARAGQGLPAGLEDAGVKEAALCRLLEAHLAACDQLRSAREGAQAGSGR